MNYETTTTKNKSEKEPFFLVQREDLYLHKLLNPNPVLQETLRSEDVS